MQVFFNGHQTINPGGLRRPPDLCRYGKKLKFLDVNKSFVADGQASLLAQGLSLDIPLDNKYSSFQVFYILFKSSIRISIVIALR